MIINIGKSWRIRSESLNWVVERRIHGAKAARHAWKPAAFLNSFDGAVVWAGRRRVMDLPGEYGVDALPLLATSLDAIRDDVRVALEAYRKYTVAGPPRT